MDVEVSVVIPAYNAQDYLKQCLESAVSQIFRSFEVIVVDDGSDDDTQKIVESYPHDIVYISQGHKGTAAARNSGIKAARGKYIAFLDSDDIWKANKLAEQTVYMDRNSDYSLAYHDYGVCNESGVILTENLPLDRRLPRPTGYIFPNLLMRCLFQTSTVLCKRSVFDDVGLFDEALLHGQDYDLWLRISAKKKIGYVPMALSYYRLRKPDGGPSSAAAEKPWEVRVVEKALVAFPREAHAARKKNLKKRLSRPYFEQGYSMFWQGRVKDALFSFYKAIKMWPANPRCLAYVVICLLSYPFDKIRIMNKRVLGYRTNGKKIRGKANDRIC